MKRAEAGAVTQPASSEVSLARVIPLRRTFAAQTSRIHVHGWTVVGDESDEFGRVREYACLGCAAVRFA